MSTHMHMCIFCGDVRKVEGNPCHVCAAMVPHGALYCPNCKVGQMDGLLPMNVATDVAKAGLDLGEVKRVCGAFEFKSLLIGQSTSTHTAERTARALIEIENCMRKGGERVFVRAVLTCIAKFNLGDPFTKNKYKSQLATAAAHFRTVYDCYKNDSALMLRKVRESNAVILKTAVETGKMTEEQLLRVDKRKLNKPIDETTDLTVLLKAKRTRTEATYMKKDEAEMKRNAEDGTPVRDLNPLTL